MTTELIPRRTLLEAAVRLAALPAGAQILNAWSESARQAQHVHSSHAPPQLSTFHNYQPQFFSPADFAALQAFTEILIPTDETPGAREAQCGSFIDFLLYSMADDSPETQKQWRSAMAALQAAGFHGASPAAREALMKDISEPERNPSAHHPAYAAYRLIKRENAFAFYTARVGIIDTLDYRGNSFNIQFPACTHPEHHAV